MEEDARTLRRRKLRFLSLNEFLAQIPSEPGWILPGYLARGSITLLAGRPKVGKSTFIFALASALRPGRGVFLERRVDPVGITLLTEERGATFQEKLQQFPLEETRVDVLPRYQAMDARWRDVVREATDHCLKHGHELLIVDTFADWASLGGDAENNAGPVQAALRPLQQAAGEGLAVLLVHHQRKAEGRKGEAIRGSNALSAGVDIVLELERGGGDDRARRLRALSRFFQTPDQLIITLAGDGYELAGTSMHGVRDEREKIAVLSAVATLGEATAAELTTSTGIPETTVRRRADSLVKEQKLVPRGSGKRGDPARWSLPSSTTTPSPNGGAREAANRGQPST